MTQHKGLWSMVLMWGVRLNTRVWAEVRGYYLALGITISVTLTIMAGVWIAQRLYAMGFITLIVSVLTLKPTLVYLTRWVDARQQREALRQTGPSDRDHDG